MSPSIETDIRQPLRWFVAHTRDPGSKGQKFRPQWTLLGRHRWFIWHLRR